MIYFKASTNLLDVRVQEGMYSYWVRDITIPIRLDTLSYILRILSYYAVDRFPHELISTNGHDIAVAGGARPSGSRFVHVLFSVSPVLSHHHRRHRLSRPSSLCFPR